MAEPRSAEWVRKKPEYVVIRDMAEQATVAARDAEEVTDEESCARAAEILTVVTQAVKAGEKRRLEATEPYRKSTDTINAQFKELTSPLQGVEERLRGEIVRFEGERREREEEAQRQHEQEVREHEEAERKAKKAAEAAAAAAAKAEEPAPAPPPAPKPPPPPPPPPREKSSRHTTTGSVSTRTVWKYTIVDEAKLPREFLKPDEPAMTAAVKAGTRAIEGVRIFPEEVAHVR